MQIINKLHFVKVTSGRASRLFCLESAKGHYVPVDEQFLSHHIRGFAQLNEKARIKEAKQFIKTGTLAAKVKLPSKFPNAKRHLHDISGKRRTAAIADLHAGTTSFLSVLHMFEQSETGVFLAAVVLAGLRCTELRIAEPQFRAMLDIRLDSPQVESAYRALVNAVVTKHRWTENNVVMNRHAILDLRVNNSLPHHIQDFDEAIIKVAGSRKLKIPVGYQDTVALLIGADSRQLHECLPFMENCGVILFNCTKPECTSVHLPPSACSRLDISIIDLLNKYQNEIAILLACWWEETDLPNWGTQIVRLAHKSFGEQDSRYISVVYDPKRLQRAILHRVILSFLDWLEYRQILSSEELISARSDVQEVFDPRLPDPIALRRVDQPDVFLELMKGIVAASTNRIVSEGEQFVKSDKPIGAWRVISGERYLVLLETTWKRVYAKACRAAPEIDTSIFALPNWSQTVQWNLGQKQIIKTASGGYRYRYDLLQNGARDTTYVVAIPARLLVD